MAKDGAPAEITVDIPDSIFACIRAAYHRSQQIKFTFMEKQHGDEEGEQITMFAYRPEGGKSS